MKSFFHFFVIGLAFQNIALGEGLSDSGFNRCQEKAIENVEAISKIAYDYKIDLTATRVLSFDRERLIFVIYTRVPGSEGLNCIYKVQMQSNVLEDCVLISATQTECGA